ncbi:kelch-like protein 40 [Gigantopelta aegis]|uniref:kelch-like protein 40 n=1 Tax=Gigantopelta aegis TaxID=1735272 RepID=UPI001B88CA93|nr:kelch-like protein 40 [Gigantopelta aegis]
MDDVQTQLLQNIHQEMINGLFSDIQVICNGGTTTGSRIALAALSPYFRAKVTSDMTESRTGVLKLPTVSLQVYKDILKMYFCKINLINEDNCRHMFVATDMMQLDYIKNLCIICMNQDLDFTPQNCLNLWRTLKLYNFLDLSKRALSCLTDNLAEFLKTGTVIDLSKAELLEIISKDDLTCREDDILKVAMKWIEHNNPEQGDVQIIFENIRLDIVGRQFLVNDVAVSNIVLENNSVREIIQHVSSSALPQRTRTTRFVANCSDVFVLHHTNNLLLSCFTSEEEWEDVPPAPVDPGQYYSAASLDHKIDITGGDEQGKCTLVYDIIGAGITVQPSLALKFGENILIMGGQVIYISGEENVSPSHVIQCFNTTTRAVIKVDTKLPCTSSTLKGYVHLPDVYLLDVDGNVMHIHITDRNGGIQVENKLTVK